MQSLIREASVFVWRNARSCIFAFSIFSLLALSHLPLPFNLARYDFLLGSCILIQLILFISGIESRSEVLVICVFHILGISMELFKVHMGSWSYPEDALTKFYGVPLYSGFMYASVASFMCQAWKNLELKLTDWPSSAFVWILAVLIYANFFASHFTIDMRWVLSVTSLFVFRKARVRFVTTRERYIPVWLSFVCIGVCIWLAENLATRLGAWQYAYQHRTWQMVSVHKVGSWTLMAIVSYIIVAQLKLLKQNMRSLWDPKQLVVTRTADVTHESATIEPIELTEAASR